MKLTIIFKYNQNKKMISIEVNEEADKEWNKNLQLSISGTLSQTKQFGDIGIYFFKAKPLFLKFLNQNGKLVGQLLIFKSFRGRKKLTELFGRNFMYSKLSKISSFLPSSLFWSYGPVIFDTSFETQISEALGEYLHSWKSKFRGSSHPFNSTFNLPSKYDIISEMMSTFIIDLNQEIDTIRNNTDKKSVQKNIKRAEERGVTVTEINSNEDLNSYYELQKKFRKDNNLVPYAKNDIVEGLIRLKKIGSVGFLAWYNNNPIGAISFSSFNGYINESAIARSKVDTEKKLYSLELLRWKIIEWGIKNRCKFYDLSGFRTSNRSAKEEGIFRNKKKWGGIKYDYWTFKN